MSKRPVGKRPPARTVTVSLPAPFEGWEATMRADYPARVLAQVQSDDVATVIIGLDTLVLDHNFPNSQGELAASMGDVEPFDVLGLLVRTFTAALGTLPPR